MEIIIEGWTVLLPGSEKKSGPAKSVTVFPETAGDLSAPGVTPGGEVTLSGFNNTEYVIYINTILIRIIRNTASTLQGISAASVASCVFLRRRRKTFGIFAVP